VLGEIAAMGIVFESASTGSKNAQIMPAGY
jgi:hypothetical protein